VCVYIYQLLFLDLFSSQLFMLLYCCQVQQFLRYVKDIYKKLPAFLPKIFEQRGQMKVHDLTEVNVDAALEETFTTTTILTEKRNAENQPISVSYCSIVIRDVKVGFFGYSIIEMKNQFFRLSNFKYNGPKCASLPHCTQVLVSDKKRMYTTCYAEQMC